MPCPLVKDLEPFVDYIKVCPEFEIGLGVPRDPIRIVKIDGEKRLIQPKTKEDITEKMNGFTTDFLDGLPEVDGFIFKADSPTIGLRNIKVYSGIEKAPVVERGRGFFAQQIFDKYKGKPMEEDNRLRNNTIRHDFLVYLFTIAGCRRAVQEGSMDELMEYHNNNNFLFALYDEEFIETGKELISNGSDSPTKTGESYLNKLIDMFSLHPNFNDYVRVWKKIIDYFGDKLSPTEKDYIEMIMGKYRNNKICYTGVSDLLFSYANRFPDGFIEKQSIFQPFPWELLPDIEKDRDRNYWK
jgi:uncharacterized protein YbbK (DUF523 family)/uncharacterized protein YbgA (DUF1722 family)